MKLMKVVRRIDPPEDPDPVRTRYGLRFPQPSSGSRWGFATRSVCSCRAPEIRTPDRNPRRAASMGLDPREGTNRSVPDRRSSSDSRSRSSARSRDLASRASAGAAERSGLPEGALRATVSVRGRGGSSGPYTTFGGSEEAGGGRCGDRWTGRRVIPGLKTGGGRRSPPSFSVGRSSLSSRPEGLPAGGGWD